MQPAKTSMNAEVDTVDCSFTDSDTRFSLSELAKATLRRSRQSLHRERPRVDMVDMVDMVPTPMFQRSEPQKLQWMELMELMELMEPMAPLGR